MESFPEAIVVNFGGKDSLFGLILEPGQGQELD
jgi:hypothetical protein